MRACTFPLMTYLGVQLLQVIGIGQRPLFVFAPRGQRSRPVGRTARFLVGVTPAIESTSASAAATTAAGQAIAYHW